MTADQKGSERSVVLEIGGGVATATLNRSAVRNAISLSLLDDLDAALDDVQRRDDVRVLVLAGAGAAFCAGLDLNGLAEGPEMVRTMLHRLSRVLRRLDRLTIPTVARVQGAAIGGGFALLLVADFAVSHAEASIGFPEPRVNLSPAVMAPWLVRKVGPGRARPMLLAGGAISGTEARRLGLLTHLADRDALESATEHLSRRLLDAPPRAIATVKTLLNQLEAAPDDQTLDQAADCSVDVIVPDPPPPTPPDDRPSESPAQ